MADDRPTGRQACDPARAPHTGRAATRSRPLLPQAPSPKPQAPSPERTAGRAAPGRRRRWPRSCAGGPAARTRPPRARAAQAPAPADSPGGPARPARRPPGSCARRGPPAAAAGSRRPPARGQGQGRTAGPVVRAGHLGDRRKVHLVFVRCSRGRCVCSSRVRWPAEYRGGLQSAARHIARLSLQHAAWDAGGRAVPADLRGPSQPPGALDGGRLRGRCLAAALRLHLVHELAHLAHARQCLRMPVEHPARHHVHTCMYPCDKHLRLRQAPTSRQATAGLPAAGAPGLW